MVKKKKLTEGGGKQESNLDDAIKNKNKIHKSGKV